MQHQNKTGHVAPFAFLPASFPAGNARAYSSLMLPALMIFA